MDQLSIKISALLSERTSDQRLRQLRSMEAIGPVSIKLQGHKLINFASNDYLGLSQHPLLKERAIKAIEQYGVGCPSSRLIAGNCELYEQIELQLAKLKGTETAIVFPTGFQTNSSILPALAKLKATFICDKLSHNSLLLGAQLAGKRFFRFAHNDLQNLQDILDKQNSANAWVVTESVFSMDGDLAPIEELTALIKAKNVALYIDEAHATGVFGKNGLGLVNDISQNVITMGTFGKGCGSFGAYIACSQQFKDFIINFCPGLIYTTALPPAVLASINAALELIPHMNVERQRLLTRAAELRQQLHNIGFDTMKSGSQIICLHVGDEEQALSLADYLKENGIYAPAIRPPTVPEKTARIRLSLSLCHSDSDINHLLKILGQWYVAKH